MSIPGGPPSEPEEKLRRIEVVTDAALAHLDLGELLSELLDRVRELLSTDMAAVLLLDPSSQLLVATAAKGLEDEVWQGVRVPLGEGFAGRIASEKRPLLLDRVDPTTVVNPILWQAGIHSIVGVPLLVGGTVLGVLHVGSLARRRFGDEDVKLLQLVADRIALAVQAGLSQGERAAARALRRSLLPTRLPEMRNLEFAARYVPGEQGLVAGDWYDVFALPSGRTGMVIGDVAGHGLPAAVVMGRLRSALRAYALESDDPAEVLGKLDNKVRHFEPGMIATVLYGIWAPGQDRLCLSSAGHLDPLVCIPGRAPAFADLKVDPPVGVAACEPRCSTVLDVPPGTLAVFFTDGLVERRTRPIHVGLDRLRAAVTAGPVDSVCSTLMATLSGRDAPEDDVTLLAVRRRE
jgi:serine phosphatase RsbU (regulator of sigma subunit)